MHMNKTMSLPPSRNPVDAGTLHGLSALVLWLAASALLVTPAALRAQTGSSESSATARKLENVIVTGTRLRTDISDGAYGLTAIGRQELELSGQRFLGEFLQQAPFMAGSPLNTSTGARGEGGGLSRGIASVELRGLGPERTLVLINGRRMVPGGGGGSGIVDLNMLPMVMVERVEIFKSGASVEYGADAVAGVVNIITREQTDGLAVNLQGTSTRRGDGEAAQLSLAYGQQRDRWQFMLGAEYVDQQSVGKGDRSFSERRLTFTGPDNTPTFDGSSAPPQGRFNTGLGNLTLIDGADGDSLSDFRPWIGDNTAPDTDRYNFNPFEDLQQPSERLSLFAQGRYSVTAAFNVFAETLYHQRDSRTRLAPLPFFTNREEDVDVSADNLFNPFGERLTDVRRRLIEGGPRDFVQDNEAWRFVLGADGTVKGWFWDVSLNRGRNTIDQRQTGDLLDSRLRTALGPSFRDSSGNAVCGTPAAPIADCVPLNLFGGAGSITSEMLAYAGTDLRDSGFNEQTVASANLAGDLFALPAGALQVAVGFEYREEKAADIPDPQTVRGNTSGSARAITRGSFDSNEAYLEVGIPLLTDAPWVQSVSMDLGTRWVDFSNFGTEVVSEAGLYWSVNESVRLRGAWSEAFRAPNVGELFGGFSQANPIVLDPCADFSRLTSVQIDRCVAQGVPADGSFAQSGEETPELSGGNRNLSPEQAEVRTLGVTWTPQSVSEFQLSLDYYDMEIDAGIASLGANTILEQCLATGAEAFCGRINRELGGRIVDVQAQLQNLATETARGLDLDAQYRHAGFGGSFSHRLMISHVLDRELVAFPGAAPFAGAGGFDRDNFGAIPEWQGNYRLDWRAGSWTVGYEAQWIGALEESGGEVFPGTVNRISDVVYHDVTVGYALPTRTSLVFGIDNLLDDQPPLFVNADEGNTDVSTYRLLGTTFWLRLTQRLL
ncbi:TonB-dependent receptor-like protein [Chromatocurvus halotolerans]|uniref:TonB-dependent receptor-like protein n=2 Tax=Chromatocurvus halotolerans TaxID=1132028 RepID=A0A4R2KN11_9GAMM|nr:TonB-dependent receptor-like protein [Chromatocurvus halotolerans]